MPEGKIIKALSGFYYVLDESEDSNNEKVIQCRGRGIFRKNKITPLVGDYVVYQAENNKEGYLLEIKERTNELIRPPICNVDQAVLVFSAVQPSFSTALLDRFLVLVEANDIQPIICITKMDLIEDQHTQKRIQAYAEDYRNIGYDVYLTSSMDQDSLTEIVPHFRDKTTVFAGQSGVGEILASQRDQPGAGFENKRNFRAFRPREAHNPPCGTYTHVRRSGCGYAGFQLS